MWEIGTVKFLIQKFSEILNHVSKKIFKLILNSLPAVKLKKDKHTIKIMDEIEN